MIIKRLATGIKNQDWFVVMVEVMIVVVGIFIGLQVDDWNQKRLDREDLKETFQELVKDFDFINKHAEAAENFHRSVVEDMRHLVQVLHEKKGVEMNEARILNALQRGDTSFTPSKPSPVYVSMVQFGKIKYILDAGLRDALIRYDGAVKTPSYMDIRLTITEWERDFRRHSHIDLDFELKNSSLDYEFEDVGIHSFDIEAMRADPDFITAAEQMLRLQYYYHMNNLTNLEAATLIKKLLQP
jgi:hypothetical protein